MKLQLPQSISNSSTIQEVITFTSNSLTKIQAIMNGNVGLVDNCSTQILTFNFTKLNVDVGVGHNLGTTPKGYMNVGSNNSALNIQNGKSANTSSTLYLQAGSTGTVSVMVFS